MERLNELTISDVKELTKDKKVTISSTDNSVMSVYMTDAIVIAEPDAAVDGKIILLKPDTRCKIELDSNDMIESIHGNENMIIITFANNIGNLDISIIGDIGAKEDYVVNQDKLCQFIKERLDKLSNLTTEDIDLILNMEMEYLQSKGIVD